MTKTSQTSTSNSSQPSALQSLLTQAAEKFEASGATRTEGNVLAFVFTHCAYRPGSEFYLCTLIHAELADREARREGFESQADRTASRAFKR